MKKCPSCGGKFSEANFYKFKAGNDIVCEFCEDLIEGGKRDEPSEARPTPVTSPSQVAQSPVKKGSGNGLIIFIVIAVGIIIVGVMAYGGSSDSDPSYTSPPYTTKAPQTVAPATIIPPTTSPQITLPPTTVPSPPKSSSNSGAIEFLPSSIEEYTTEERYVEINRGCITAARGKYLVKGSTGDSVAVFVCHSPNIDLISAGKGEIPGRYSEFDMGPGITLSADIQAYYAYDVIEHMSLIWWTDGEYYFNVLAVSDSGVGNTKNMATYISNAIIQNQQ